MSWTTVREWGEVVRESALRMAEYLGPQYEDDVRTLHGPTFRKGCLGRNDYENAANEWIGVLKSQLTLANPMVTVSTSRIGPAKFDAIAQTYAMNRLIVQTDVKGMNDQLVPDFCLRFGVIATRPECVDIKDPKGPWLPVMRRVDPRDFICDFDARHSRDFTFTGQLIVVSRDKLLLEAKRNPELGWRTAEIAKMPPLTRDGPDMSRSRPQRDLVAYYEVWDKYGECDKSNDDENGVLYTIPWNYSGNCPANEVDFIRDEQPHYGPTWGPLTLFGADVVPGDPIPLSPINSSRLQDTDFNLMAEVISRANADYRRFGVVDQAASGIADLIKSGDNSKVYVGNLQDIGKQFAEITLGGASPEQVAYFEFRRQARDRALGINDQVRGQVDSQATATAAGIAAQFATSKIAGVIDAYRSGLKRALMTQLWYLVFDERVRVQVSSKKPQFIAYDEEEKTLVKSRSIEYRGGKSKLDPDGTFQDLDLDIDLFSMGRTGEMRIARQLEGLMLIPQIAPLLASAPWVAWNNWSDEVGRLYGIEDYETYTDPDLAAKIGAMMMGANAAPQAQPQAAEQPRMSFDNGPQVPAFGPRSSGQGTGNGTAGGLTPETSGPSMGNRAAAGVRGRSGTGGRGSSRSAGPGVG